MLGERQVQRGRDGDTKKQTDTETEECRERGIGTQTQQRKRQQSVCLNFFRMIIVSQVVCVVNNALLLCGHMGFDCRGVP